LRHKFAGKYNVYINAQLHMSYIVMIPIVVTRTGMTNTLTTGRYRSI